MKRLINYCLTIILTFSLCQAMTDSKIYEHEDYVFTLRRANMDDLDSIMNLYNGFNDLDRPKLVVLPGPIQKQKVSEAIDSGRFFVAIDNETGHVVSFLKLFIPEKEECYEILEQELQAIGDDSLLMENGLYFFNKSNITNYRKRLRLIENDDDRFYYDLSTQVFVYYGGAYTAQEYREKRLNTALHDFAFKQIEINVYRQGKTVNREDYTIILIYGQVEANLLSQGILRCFAKLILSYSTNDPEVDNPQFVISSFSYLASKPEFELDIDGELKIIIPDERRDRGQILIFENTFNLKKKKSRTNLKSSTNGFYSNYE